MRHITYKRYEPHPGFSDEKKEPLIVFIYDVPRIGSSGIFPPLHILNQILSAGGGDSGMSPGALWEGFELVRCEYEELCQEIEKTDPQSLKSKSRYMRVKFEFAQEFDLQDRFAWKQSVSDKYRQEFFRKQDENSK